jgi:glycosyltransferase involved in cell wall biosynthesis
MDRYWALVACKQRYGTPLGRLATAVQYPRCRMRILHAHKYLRPYSGAETAFLHTRELLAANGHEVIDFSMKDPRNEPSEFEKFFAPPRSFEGPSRVDRRLRDGLNAIYSVSARKALSRLLDEQRPDVAHLHSVYHQLSLSIVDELSARGIPIVMTLHDYKIACPSYTLFTEGAPCRRCVHGSPVNAIVHRCLQHSVAVSALAAAEAAVVRARKTYHRVALFLTPSRFVGSVAEAAGMPRHKVRFMPYFLPDEELQMPVVTGHREPTFLFGGRLTETKGVGQMLRAFERTQTRASLKVAGFGPLADEVKAAAARDARITYLGALPRRRLLEELSSARALLLPSVWEDNCPLVMLESQARATPVIGSNRGGPPEFIRDQVDGRVVDPTDVEALSRAIEELAQDGDKAAEFGHRARERLVAEHNAADHYAALLNAYDSVRGTDRR